MEIVECDHAFAHFWGNEMLEVVENGGQGRNRTADASLFRAALNGSYLLHSQAVPLFIAAHFGQYFVTITRPQL